MKKVIRILGLCALVVFAFTSCKKNDNNNSKIVSFKASTVHFNPDSDSKTHIGGMDYPFAYLVWDSANVIKVFDADGNHADFMVTALSDDKKEAEFHIYEGYTEFMEDLPIDNSYKAFYPNAVEDHGMVKLSVPSRQVQTFFAGFGGANVDNNTFPMYGHNQDTGFIFATDACVMRIEMYKNNIHTHVDSVVFSSKTTGEFIAGNLVYNMNGILDHFEGISPTITVVSTYEPTDWTTTTTSMSFVVILPKDVFATGFNMDVYEGSTMISHNEGYVKGPNGQFPYRTMPGWFYTPGGPTLP